MSDEDDPKPDRVTPYWRWGMGILGAAVLSTVTYAAKTVRDIETEITKIETGYAIEIPALKGDSKEMRKSIDDLWKAVYQNGGR